MGKTVAERQAAYRKQRPYAGKDSNGERRLNTWVSTRTSLALARLARKNKLSQRDMLERLVQNADDAILDSLVLDTPGWDIYFNGE
jgi:hypothetical protein